MVVAANALGITQITAWGTSFYNKIGVAITPSTAPYSLAPNSARGTAPRTIVMDALSRAEQQGKGHKLQARPVRKKQQDAR